MRKIHCFIQAQEPERLTAFIAELSAHPAVGRIFLLGKSELEASADGCTFVRTDGQFGSGTMRTIGRHLSGSDYAMVVTEKVPIRQGQFAIERFLSVAGDTGAGMVYSDHHDLVSGQLRPHPLIDYQQGSLRDDFDFGPILFFSSRVLRETIEKVTGSFTYAGLYRVRLKIGSGHPVVRIPEYLYTAERPAAGNAERNLFDYLDPAGREVQEEMERAVTLHLKEIGAYLAPSFREVAPEEGAWDTEATVIIPVLNRERTIADAIGSVMRQKAGFSFNLIVVDNHSSDRTTEIIREAGRKYENLVHLIPERRDLGIGGCWNEAVHHPACGRFAVQLDSDDLYAEETLLEQMVATFYRERCAMVIGSYRLTDFDLNEIPPGIVDHREWTADNGRNNALRINGLGAPRAFFTPVLRQVRIPNVSYGEDYAVALAISRHYRIGRIYQPVYLCRRWEDNTDASLDVATRNSHDTYKDRLRTIELSARIRMNRKKEGT